jgi:glucose-1-phosphate thymidylyltransferase
MENTLKVVIPMAGLGTRLRPHTWSKPKQLVSVAGKPVLDHVLDMLSTLSEPENVELINIVGYLGDQIEDHMTKCYPNIKSHFVLQDNPRGQSHAIYLAREYLTGPMMIVFADTLIETDLSNLSNETFDAVAWVKSVPDPRRFGVAVVNQQGKVTKLIEKPKETDNNLAVVGFYYFNSSEDLISAIEEQVQQDLQLKGEYLPEALLETNRYLLENGHSNSQEVSERSGVVINPPVYVHPTAELKNCVIGPHASIGSGAHVVSSIIRDSILEDEAQVLDVILESSLIGRRSQIQRRAGSINAGDNTVVFL